MRYLLGGLVLVFSCLSVRAQTTEDSIKTTINTLFTAVRASDSAALMTCFAPDAILQTIAKDKSGNNQVHSTSIASFAAIIAKLAKGAGDEQITFGSIQIDRPLATVWTPYRFFYQGNFSHCGVNAFQLVQLADGWKIQYIIDTRRKDNCITAAAK
jgi:hypothetical protein